VVGIGIMVRSSSPPPWLDLFVSWLRPSFQRRRRRRRRRRPRRGVIDDPSIFVCDDEDDAGRIRHGSYVIDRCVRIFLPM